MKTISHAEECTTPEYGRSADTLRL